jgi:Fe-S-cluster containining protein
LWGEPSAEREGNLVTRKLLFPENFHFTYTGCGRCCKDWNIHVDAGCYGRVHGTSLYERLKTGGEEPFKEDGDDGTISSLRKKGACVFLDDHDRCTIHSEIGYEAKPLGCRQFPFILRPTPDGVYAGVSFYCPSCRSNSGLPLSSYKEDIENWLSEHNYSEVTDQSLELMEKYPLAWEDYRVIEDFIREVLEKGSYREKSLRQALIAAASLITSGRGGDFFHAPPGTIRGLLQHAYEVDYGNGEVFEEMCLFFAFAVIGVSEAETPGGARAVTEAAMGGGAFRSLTFEKEIQMADFSRFYAGHPLVWKEAAIGRYMDHLLFRKFLAGPEPVFHRLAVMDIIYNLTDFYLYLSAFQDGQREPAMDDLYRAFGIIEKGFTAHTRTMVPFFKAFAEGFLDLLQKLSRPA